MAGNFPVFFIFRDGKEKRTFNTVLNGIEPGKMNEFSFQVT